MNTLLLAMTLDYPPDKLHVYLSDEGGYAITLHGMKEAWKFARWWLTFCRRYDIKIRCPEVYFSRTEEDYSDSKTSEFMEERRKIKEKYELFKERATRARKDSKFMDIGVHIACDHPSCIEVIQECSKEELQEDQIKMPLLIYVSREKRISQSHHFKAGAINVLMSPSFAFVQFPQTFHDISKNDIYDSELRSIFVILWTGLDGLRGPVLSGTNFYIKREALCGSSIQKGIDLRVLKNSFGPSNEFIKSLHQNYKLNLNNDGEYSNMLLEEAKVLASCSYEDHTKWGKEASFLYDSVAEDFLTGFTLQCKGWKSAYVAPSRPQFLRNLVFIVPSSLLPASLVLCHHLSTLSAKWHSLVSDPYFSVFLFIFLSTLSKHLQEVLITGRPIHTWINEQRIWMIKSVTCHLYGSLDAILKKLSLRKASFLTTNKVADDEQIKLYHEGKFDFRASTIFVAPLVTIILVNLASIAGGIVRMMAMGAGWRKMFGQILLSFYIIVMNSAIIEGMVMRKDKGRILSSVTLLSVVFSLIFLSLGSIIACILL
ncbi:hypothetical protein CRYUN_Cryun10bG0035900 [Craigia yunnanensis]